jgi:hypothetical protein
MMAHKENSVALAGVGRYWKVVHGVGRYLPLPPNRAWNAEECKKAAQDLGVQAGFDTPGKEKRDQSAKKARQPKRKDLHPEILANRREKDKRNKREKKHQLVAGVEMNGPMQWGWTPLMQPPSKPDAAPTCPTLQEGESYAGALGNGARLQTSAGVEPAAVSGMKGQQVVPARQVLGQVDFNVWGRKS